MLKKPKPSSAGLLFFFFFLSASFYIWGNSYQALISISETHFCPLFARNTFSSPSSTEVTSFLSDLNGSKFDTPPFIYPLDILLCFWCMVVFIFTKMRWEWKVNWAKFLVGCWGVLKISLRQLWDHSEMQPEGRYAHCLIVCRLILTTSICSW